MKAKKKRRRTGPTDNCAEIISLRNPQALLLANDRMNEDFDGEYVAFLDKRRGMKLYRRIVAHGTDLVAINHAIDGLAAGDRKNISLHYAYVGKDDVLEVHWDLPWRL